jgi:hypothetical protein
VSRVVHSAGAVLFLFSAVVQWNDPDPLPWMAIYGAASILCVAAAMGLGRLRWPATIAGLAMVWAIVIFTGLADLTAFTRMFTTYEMMSADQEEAREILGLAIVILWMLGLVAEQLAAARARSRLPS